MIFSKITVAFKNEHIKQASVLYLVSFLNIIIGMATTYFLTKILGPYRYGDYCFIINIYTFSQVFFLFGYFHSGGRLLALSTDDDETRKIYGGELLISLGIFVVMSIFLIVYALTDSNLTEKGLTNIFCLTIPFGGIFILMSYFEVLLQGDNKIYLLAKSRLWPKVYYLIGLVILFFLIGRRESDFKATIFLYFFSFIFTYIFILRKISPSLSNLKWTMKKINQANKSYGFNIYLGSVFAVAASHLTGILISYFGVNNIGVGYFTIASSLCAPLAIIPNIIATTYFKNFATQDRIDNRVIKYTIALTLISAFLICGISKPFVILLYGYKYLPVVKMVYFLAIGISLYGLSDLVNRFLGAHGQGEALRNSSIIVGLFLLCSNIFLIKNFSELGAVYSKIVAGLIYVICIYTYYIKYIYRLSNSKL